MGRFYRTFAGVLSLALVGVVAFAVYLQVVLPDKYYVVEGESFSINGRYNISATGLADSLPKELYSKAGNSYNMKLSLPMSVAIKQVSVQVVERDMVIVGGRPFGIKMFTDGVMIVGMSDIDQSGKMVNPAKSAGLKVGDIILSLNGEKMAMNEDVARVVSACKGRSVDVVYKRKEEVLKTTMTPILVSVDSGYKAGMWVRDSSAGIGTMTYYNPETQIFAGLGHAICDVDTGDVMPLASGEAVDVTITGVKRGASGLPGELKGMFTGTRKVGRLLLNNNTGVYGHASFPPVQGQPVPLAMRQEVKEGPAFIYTTLEGTTPECYSICIEKVADGDLNPTKNMVIRITDPRLLEKTGGIVQGMSGSPILQNNKLVGAVTHVFVNDPTRGYGIFAENMEKSAKEVAYSLKKAS